MKEDSMRRWFETVAVLFFLGSSMVASDEFFSHTRLGALADAHEAFLDGDHARVAPLIRDAIREAAGDAEVTRSGIALLELLYVARAGRPISVDWELPPNLDRLKISVVRRDNAYWTEYGLRVWGKQREAGLVDQIRLTRADGEVVLDRREQRGTWWSLDDAEDGPEFELAFWENEHRPADGLYDLHLEFADGTQWDAWLILSDAVASETPTITQPAAGEILESSRPRFEFEDFRSPEHDGFERRSLWYSLSNRSASSPLFSRWEVHPTRTGFEPEQELSDGDYTVSVFFAEDRRFGPLLIGRNSGSLVPFSVRTAAVEP